MATSLPFTSILNFSSTIKDIVSGSKNSFTNRGTVEINPGQSFLLFVIFIIILYLTMLLGSCLFNASVVKIFPSVKKVSVLDFFGLYIVIHLLFC